MAVEAGKPSTGSVKTELRENAVGLPGMLMQGIATIGPSFAILASFVFIVSFAGLVTPWAYLFGGILLGLQALSAAQLAKVFPSAGGWYTWIARAFHPRAGFFAGVLFSIWLPPVATLTMVRYERFGLGQTWNVEYGTASDAEQLGWLLAYSPYHHVTEGTRYPAVLFTVFTNDTRVDPVHAYKMCAALQDATSSGPERPVLLRAEAQVGHGARAVSRMAELSGDTLSFAARYTGLTV